MYLLVGSWRAVELAREGVAVNIIQRQLGHTDLGTTSTYLQGVDPSEIIDARPLAPSTDDHRQRQWHRRGSTGDNPGVEPRRSCFAPEAAWHQNVGRRDPPALIDYTGGARDDRHCL
jgi:hypothetical protein